MSRPSILLCFILWLSCVYCDDKVDPIIIISRKGTESDRIRITDEQNTPGAGDPSIVRFQTGDTSNNKPDQVGTDRGNNSPNRRTGGVFPDVERPSPGSTGGSDGNQRPSPGTIGGSDGNQRPSFGSVGGSDGNQRPSFGSVGGSDGNQRPSLGSIGGSDGNQRPSDDKIDPIIITSRKGNESDRIRITDEQNTPGAGDPSNVRFHTGDTSNNKPDQQGTDRGNSSPNRGTGGVFPDVEKPSPSSTSGSDGNQPNQGGRQGGNNPDAGSSNSGTNNQDNNGGRRPAQSIDSEGSKQPSQGDGGKDGSTNNQGSTSQEKPSNTGTSKGTSDTGGDKGGQPNKGTEANTGGGQVKTRGSGNLKVNIKCPLRPENCGHCFRWDEESKCNGDKDCDGDTYCCETFCCWRECTKPQQR